MIILLQINRSKKHLDIFLSECKFLPTCIFMNGQIPRLSYNILACIISFPATKPVLKLCAWKSIQR